MNDDTVPLLQRKRTHLNGNGQVSFYNAMEPIDSCFEEVEEGEVTDWRSMTIAYFLMAINVVQFTMYFASMFPFLKQIDATATTSFFGYVVAIYSVGQMISSPLFGWWSTKRKTTREPILLGVVINIAANVAYWFAEDFPPPRRWVLFSARFMVGISAGNLGVLRAFVAESSAAKDKVSAVSIANMVITLGFIIGPGFQAIFAPIGYPGTQLGNVHLDMYTSPALFAIALGLLSIVILFTCYREKYIGIRDKTEDPNSTIVIPPFDRLAAFTCLWLWFTTLCYFTVSESLVHSVCINRSDNINRLLRISAPFTMVMFDWTRAETTQNVGIIYAASGGISCIVYLAALYLKAWIDLRKAVILGFLLMFLFYFISFPWPGLPGKLSFRNDSLTTAENSSVEQVGCPPTFDWCHDTPKIEFSQYIMALVCGSIGYPIATAYVSVIFTLVIGPRRQGTMQGLFTMFGSTSRCIAPFFVSSTFEKFGPRTPWIVTGVLMLSGALLVGLCYRRLVPLDVTGIDKEKLQNVYKHSVISVE